MEILAASDDGFASVTMQVTVEPAAVTQASTDIYLAWDEACAAYGDEDCGNSGDPACRVEGLYARSIPGATLQSIEFLAVSNPNSILYTSLVFLPCDYAGTSYGPGSQLVVNPSTPVPASDLGLANHPMTQPIGFVALPVCVPGQEAICNFAARPNYRLRLHYNL